MAPPMFSDLNVLWKADQSLFDKVEMGTELGYQRVAINYLAQNLQSGKGKKHTEKYVIPPPSEILLNAESLKDLKNLKGRHVEQLSRFTAVLQDASNTHKLGSPEVQAYDLVCVQTTNEKTFQLACSTLDIDIISLNLSESLGFSLKRALVNVAVKRGIHFEIVYAPALRDNSARRCIISNAMSLVSAGGGKNIIISSGCDQTLDLRSPYDVINLAKLFGLSHTQAKDAISNNCRAVLKHAESRRTCKSVVSAIRSSALSLKESWILTHRGPGQKRKSEDKEESDANSEKEGSSDQIGASDEDSNGEEDVVSHAKKIKLK